MRPIRLSSGQMRKLSLWLGVSLVVGCGNPPGEVATDGATTESSPTSSPSTTSNDSTAGSSGMSTTMSATTGPEVCPPMPPEGGYDPCPGLCGGGGQCFSDHVDYAVCTRGCFMDCNCWSAPNDGDAPASCSSELLESTSVCVLDCSGGQTCPRGMFCVEDLGICAFPFPGSETAESSSDSGGSTDGSSSGGSSSGGSTSGGSSSGGSSSGGSSSGGATGTGTGTGTT